jgi:predicted metal-dependent hydrolase
MYMRLVIGNKRKQKSVIKVADLVAEAEWKWIRNIYLRISPADARIRISAPMTMSEEEIKKFMLSKEVWIRQRIDRANVQKRPAPYEYVSGEYHYYKGHKYSLKVVCHNGAAKVETEGNEYIILYVREGTTMKRREEVLREWYRAELKVLLTELIAKWEQIIGVKANQITVKQMKTIYFPNWRKIKAELNDLYI